MKTRLIAALFAVSTTLSLQSCVENPPGSEWQRPPRYGHGGTNQKPNSTQKKRKPENRFGYSGDDSGAPPSDSGPSATRDRDVEPIASGDNGDDGGGDSGEPPAVEKPSGPPKAGEMPFAKGVPGDPLHVRLPGRSDLPKISIEQVDSGGQPTGKPLPPGTPVSIADPNNPGKEIFFKVP